MIRGRNLSLNKSDDVEDALVEVLKRELTKIMRGRLYVDLLPKPAFRQPVWPTQTPPHVYYARKGRERM